MKNPLPKLVLFSTPFFFDSCSILPPFWAPFWHLGAFKNTSFSSMGPRGSPRGPSDRCRTHFGADFAHFGIDFGRFGGVFGHHFGNYNFVIKWLPSKWSPRGLSDLFRIDVGRMSGVNAEFGRVLGECATIGGIRWSLRKNQNKILKTSCDKIFMIILQFD